MGEECILCNKSFANGEKIIEIYCDESFNDNEELVEELIISYDISYHDGQGKHGYASLELESVLKAYELEDYDALKQYLYDKYRDDDQSWKKILQEFRDKGLTPYENEDESFIAPSGNQIWSNL